MSTRSRKTLQNFGYLLGLDIVVAVLGHFHNHASWSHTVIWAAEIPLALVVLVTAYTWWLYSSPERVAELQARKAGRKRPRLGG